jgi:hypothetical protein
MLNPANSDIDFMQLLQLVNTNSGLSYADDIEKTTQQAVRHTLELVTTDPSQVYEAFLTKLFTELQQHRMGVLTHVTEIQKDALEKINQKLNTITFFFAGRDQPPCNRSSRTTGAYYENGAQNIRARK